MKHLSTLLFALSLILINPWGDNRGEIWTYPKVFAILLITLLNLSIEANHSLLGFLSEKTVILLT